VKGRIEGNQVFLRHPAPQDSDEFTELSRANRRFHLRLASPPKDAESFREFVERGQKPENEFFLICRKRDGAVTGAINLSQIFRGGFQNAYLGYYLGEEFAGRGFMTEAIKLILRYAFRDLKLHRIEANIQPHNLASIAVVRKNGFTKEGFSPKYLKIGGRWRDHERWAITREDWIGKR
jgi:ribosomal-protein-alanine N-acetyltransferase